MTISNKEARDWKQIELTQDIEKDLKDRISKGEGPDQTLWDAMSYSLLAGGKRIRPLLLMLTGLSLGASKEDLLPFASALEMIHTYSLIHDDLPAMDNDDYRRGRLTNHKVYGEAQAILAGDGLLNLAFETMSDSCYDSAKVWDHDKTICKLQAMAYMAHASGAKGMIAGQSADLMSEDKTVSSQTLAYTEFNKTSRLLMSALYAGAAVAGAGEDVLDALENAGGMIGLAFQIRDDVLDVEGTLEKLGKMQGSDEKSAKSTFVSLYGLERAKKEVFALTDQALEELRILPGECGESARALIRSLAYRDH